MYLMQGALIADSTVVAWEWNTPDTSGDHYPDGTGLVDTGTIVTREIRRGEAPADVLLPLAPYATSTVPAFVGSARLDPATLTKTGYTLALTLEALGAVSSGGLTGTLELLDASDLSVVESLTWTEVDLTRKTATLTVPLAATTYLVSLTCAGATLPGDYAVLGAANLRLAWS